ncbi:MAG: Crp/Fnr family transcriptional regulator [Nitrospirae bacterium]|nr:Crp/Fnr family transcriptional regulator [Nitrospirota bacterium]
MDKPDLLFLRTVPLLSFLTDQEIQEIKPLLIEQLYEKGTFVFQEGEKAEWFYFLKKGAIKCLKFSLEGKELILKVLLPGEIFCCEAVTFDGTAVHPGNAQAMVPTTVLKLSRKVYFDLLKNHPPATLEVISYLGGRLKESQDQAKSIALDPAEKRIAALLLRLAEKVGEQEKEGVRIGIPLSREEIAHMTGMTEETAVRIVSRFKEQRILLPECGKKLVVCNMEALRKLASFVPLSFVHLLLSFSV